MVPLRLVARMGSLPFDTRCGWCGRRGATYIPDGIHPPVPLCADGEGCLSGNRDRQAVMLGALGAAVCIPHWPPRGAPEALVVRMLDSRGAPEALNVCSVRIARFLWRDKASRAPDALILSLSRVAGFL